MNDSSMICYLVLILFSSPSIVFNMRSVEDRGVEIHGQAACREADTTPIYQVNLLCLSVLPSLTLREPFFLCDENPQ